MRSPPKFSIMVPSPSTPYFDTSNLLANTASLEGDAEAQNEALREQVATLAAELNTQQRIRRSLQDQLDFVEYKTINPNSLVHPNYVRLASDKFEEFLDGLQILRNQFSSLQKVERGYEGWQEAWEQFRKAIDDYVGIEFTEEQRKAKMDVGELTGVVRSAMEFLHDEIGVINHDLDVWSHKATVEGSRRRRWESIVEESRTQTEGNDFGATEVGRKILQVALESLRQIRKQEILRAESESEDDRGFSEGELSSLGLPELLYEIDEMTKELCDRIQAQQAKARMPSRNQDKPLLDRGEDLQLKTIQDLKAKLELAEQDAQLCRAEADAATRASLTDEEMGAILQIIDTNLQTNRKFGESLQILTRNTGRQNRIALQNPAQARKHDEFESGSDKEEDTSQEERYLLEDLKNQVAENYDLKQRLEEATKDHYNCQKENDALGSQAATLQLQLDVAVKSKEECENQIIGLLKEIAKSRRDLSEAKKKEADCGRTKESLKGWIKDLELLLLENKGNPSVQENSFQNNREGFRNDTNDSNEDGGFACLQVDNYVSENSNNGQAGPRLDEEGGKPRRPWLDDRIDFQQDDTQNDQEDIEAPQEGSSVRARSESASEQQYKTLLERNQSLLDRVQALETTNEELVARINRQNETLRMRDHDDEEGEHWSEGVISDLENEIKELEAMLKKCRSETWQDRKARILKEQQDSRNRWLTENTPSKQSSQRHRPEPALQQQQDWMDQGFHGTRFQAALPRIRSSLKNFPPDKQSNRTLPDSLDEMVALLSPPSTRKKTNRSTRLTSSTKKRTSDKSNSKRQREHSDPQDYDIRESAPVRATSLDISDKKRRREH